MGDAVMDDGQRCSRAKQSHGLQNADHGFWCGQCTHIQKATLMDISHSIVLILDWGIVDPPVPQWKLTQGQ